jgi:hypothetical protein
MRAIVVALLPAFLMAAAPSLVSQEKASTDAYHFYSPGRAYEALVEYETGNTEYVPFSRFALKDKSGTTVYSKQGRGHTLLDIADNGTVVGIDFDGPISGRAKLHFYNVAGVEQGTAEVGFLDRRAFSADGRVYCVNDGKRGLRVFTVEGRELYNLGKGNRFAVSADGKQVVLAQDDAILLFTEGKQTSRIPGSSPFIRQMRFSPDGSLFGYVDRRELHLFRVATSEPLFVWRPEDAGFSFTSLDIASDMVLAGLDRDAGRGTSDRHKRGRVCLLDLAGKPVWCEDLAYSRWNAFVPAVRFCQGRAFEVRTATDFLNYEIQGE